MRTKKNADDKPYVDNYPPLADFLRSIDARCNWQIPLGPDHAPNAYIEQWMAPNGATMIVTVHANQNGWDIATPCRDGKVEATLADVRARLGLEAPPKADP